MPVPATIGKLRTKVNEMEIGDYIPMHYNSTTRYQFKNGSKGELPVIGAGESSSIDLHWYMVKVAKGLLVADRVWQHSRSWDSLNESKAIQGFPIDFGNIIPAMTSNTYPSGVASASLNDEIAYKAFDNVNVSSSGADAWFPGQGVQSGILSYEFPTEQLVSAYSVIRYYNQIDNTYSPKDWTFEGWNGNEWVILDKQVNKKGWTTPFILSKPVVYKKFRINVTATHGGNLIIGELQLHETIGIIRSLTGGVAYADVNGDKSLTIKGFGGWPVNNEWDQYIVGFPQELVQEGKTLDDVFHWKTGVATHCQETPVNGFIHPKVNSTIGANNFRIYRGEPDYSLGIEGSAIVVSNYKGGNLGFRPVFEYKEV